MGSGNGGKPKKKETHPENQPVKTQDRPQGAQEVQEAQESDAAPQGSGNGDKPDT